METDIHTVLDSLTLITTIWVVYMMRFNLKSTYSADRDTVPLYYVSVGFTSAFGFILAVLWFFSFGLILAVNGEYTLKEKDQPALKGFVSYC